MKSKMTFVILNYETYWETIKCVQSIYKTIGYDNISKKNHNIIIVDNGSKNDSFSKLEDKYKGFDSIYLLRNEQNLGFAKGNNIGFKYAKENLKPNFIVMINSDIVMTDNQFEKKLLDAYKQYNFSVAGPNVVLPNGTTLNPVMSNLITINDVGMAIKGLNKQIKMCELGIEPLNAAIMRIARKFKNSKFVWDKNCVLNKEKGLQLHGCFLIFSKEYIERFDGIYEKTFLYGEETLLRLRCIRADMSMYFIKNINALHNESKTEKFIGGKINERHLRRYINSRDSSRIIYEYMKSDDI